MLLMRFTYLNPNPNPSVHSHLTQGEPLFMGNVESMLVVHKEDDKKHVNVVINLFGSTATQININDLHINNIRFVARPDDDPEPQFFAYVLFVTNSYTWRDTAGNYHNFNDGLCGISVILPGDRLAGLVTARNNHILDHFQEREIMTDDRPRAGRLHLVRE